MNFNFIFYTIFYELESCKYTKFGYIVPIDFQKKKILFAIKFKIFYNYGYVIIGFCNYKNIYLISNEYNR